jgi:hypothetical protein
VDTIPHRLAPPVAGAVASPQSRFRLRMGYVVLALVLCLPLLCVLGIAGYFRLSSATQALQSSVIESVPVHWDKRFAAHVGGFTLGLVRLGSHCFNFPPEPKAALEALCGAEVGVYRLEAAPSAQDYSAMFAAADKSTKRRGWERIVGVAGGKQLVAVFMPRQLHSLKRMACCVVVLNEQDLVVASVRGSLEPLLGLATQQLDRHDLPWQRLKRDYGTAGQRDHESTDR